MTDPWIKDIVIDPQTPDTLYTATYDGVFKSMNGGGSWSAVSNGLPSQYTGGLAIDPKTPGTLYVIMGSGGIYKSVNGGQSWTEINNGLQPLDYPVKYVAIDPKTPDTLYAGCLRVGGSL